MAAAFLDAAEVALGKEPDGGEGDRPESRFDGGVATLQRQRQASFSGDERGAIDAARVNGPRGSRARPPAGGAPRPIAAPTP